MQSFCFWRSFQSMIGSRSDKQKIIKPFLNLIPQRKWKEWKKNNFWNLQEEKWHREHIKYCSHFKTLEQRTFCSMKPDWSLKDEEKLSFVGHTPPPPKKWDRTNCNCKDNRWGKISEGRRKGSDLIWQIRKASTITSESCKVGMILFSGSLAGTLMVYFRTVFHSIKWKRRRSKITLNVITCYKGCPLSPSIFVLYIL